MLILIYNRMFHHALRLEELDIPGEIEFTEDRRRMREADAVVFHIPSLDRFFYRRKIRRQTWVSWYMECELNYPRLRNARFMQQFDLTMNYRQNADIMASYLPSPASCLSIAPERTNRHRNLVCSFISGWTDRSGRGAYLRELAKRLDVHQYGRCGNRSIPGDRGSASKLDVCSTYKFNLAFENAIAVDYVTEKFYEPLLAGCVPVYLGAPNVAEFAPVEDCYINTNNFSGPAELAEYLLYLDRDDQAYGRYLNWRERPYNSSFQALCRKNEAPAFERLCRLLMERAARA